MTMRGLTIGMCLTVTLAAGCSGLARGREDLKADNTPNQRVIELQERVDRLNTELAVRDARIEELRQRAEALNKEMLRQKFLNTQQERQIKTLANAPVERDEYKQLAEEIKQLLRMTNERLAKAEAENKLLKMRLQRISGQAGTQPVKKDPPAEAPQEKEW